MLQPLLIDLLGDAVEKKRWIATVCGDQFVDSPANYIDGLVGEIFGFPAAFSCKDANETRVDAIVFFRRLVAVGIQPGEQFVKTFVTWRNSLAHRLSQVSKSSVGVKFSSDINGAPVKTT